MRNETPRRALKKLEPPPSLFFSSNFIGLSLSLASPLLPTPLEEELALTEPSRGPGRKYPPSPAGAAVSSTLIGFGDQRPGGGVSCQKAEFQAGTSKGPWASPPLFSPPLKKHNQPPFKRFLRLCISPAFLLRAPYMFNPLTPPRGKV